MLEWIAKTFSTTGRHLLIGFPKQIFNFLREAGAGAMGHEMIAKAKDAAVEWATDPEGLRERFVRCLMALYADNDTGKNLWRWYQRTYLKVKKGQEWVKNTNRLKVGGKKIGENTFIRLVAGFKGSDRQFTDLLRHLDTMTESKFCDYLNMGWNNQLGQNADEALMWLKEKAKATGTKATKKIRKAKRVYKTQTKSVIERGVKKAKKTVRRQMREFTSRINDATAEQELKNAMRGW